MRNPRFLLRAAAPVLMLALASCGDDTRTSPVEPSRPALAVTGAVNLLECPADVGASATATIDLLGGTLRVVDAVGGTHEVVFPANAVTLPTVFTLAVPAGQYMEVRVTARDALTGRARSVSFPADAQPTLAVSYKRCTRSNVLKQEMRLYNIDEATDAVLEGPFGGKEGGTTDPRVRGKVPHFSDYAIGTG